jgi:hypothetical protein
MAISNLSPTSPDVSAVGPGGVSFDPDGVSVNGSAVFAGGVSNPAKIFSVGETATVTVPFGEKIDESTSGLLYAAYPAAEAPIVQMQSNAIDATMTGHFFLDLAGASSASPRWTALPGFRGPPSTESIRVAEVSFKYP